MSPEVEEEEARTDIKSDSGGPPESVDRNLNFSGRRFDEIWGEKKKEKRERQKKKKNRQTIRNRANLSQTCFERRSISLVEGEEEKERRKKNSMDVKHHESIVTCNDQSAISARARMFPRGITRCPIVSKLVQLPVPR